MAARKKSSARALTPEEEETIACEVLSGALGRPVTIDDPDEIQKAIIRVIFAAKTLKLLETLILEAFLAAWPYVSDSQLRVTVMAPRPPPKAKAAKKMTSKKTAKRAKR